MLNYMNCSVRMYNTAMSFEDKDVSEISDEHLYILYTKFLHDSLCVIKRVEKYGAELERRGIIF